MITTERRFDVRLISAEAMSRYMTFRGIKVRDLARMVGCSRSTIGSLRSGARSYVRDEWARSIEKFLQAPPGSLFAPELSTVAREKSRSA